MKWEMELLSPSPYASNGNWFLGEGRTAKWTPAENKMFEKALAVHDKDTPDRWHRVASLIPGKTVEDVVKHYKDLVVDVSNIEAGLIPIPGYSTTSPFTLEWVNGHGYDGFKQSYGLGGKGSSSIRPPEQERKKGVPWTEEEHKLFLMGLKKYGKGDWRNISRNFVGTRTPTQVASHAQKYFIRQLSGGKDKRRASIHDITTVNLTETRTPSPDDKGPPSPGHSSMVARQQTSVAAPRTPFLWNQPNNGGPMTFHATQGDISMCPHFGVNSSGLKFQGHNTHRGTFINVQNPVFHMQAGQSYPHG
ncbi:transcription factor DIVARICATA-like [Rhodamnia argentea]|uniref:Transcription factor DIVARICATA-like n=1 Tax=Rhodamnia argentea TaxID=178133 RepID=A0A8B8NP44_9MYRT|nr:transcription factor DIVARICATA-like [Rhodamnia argentea]XP_048140035.1 transcription factor DIVARICATA-like [Rhodamnia argentea]